MSGYDNAVSKDFNIKILPTGCLYSEAVIHELYKHKESPQENQLHLYERKFEFQRKV
jgi:hypothetical protein